MKTALTGRRGPRLGDRRCLLCFGFFPLEELNPVGDDRVEDVCMQCAEDEDRDEGR